MIDWLEPLEAVHDSGEVRDIIVGQLNAGVYPGNDHWLCTLDKRRLDATPGAIAMFWASAIGTVPSYAGWRIRNKASDHA